MPLTRLSFFVWEMGTDRWDDWILDKVTKLNDEYTSNENRWSDKQTSTKDEQGKRNGGSTKERELEKRKTHKKKVANYK